ncbi:MAG: class I SAM-dependent rRNA methyltransferase [Gammaproteobacteria bacterium]|nr:class I SAM-dependent rRNA methyltransferase [Gammaproteobacteria bacterium]
MSPATIKLNKNADRRIREGHSWIYSNEINTRLTSLKNFEAGDIVDVVNHQDKWLGRGYINPNSLICIRLLTRDKKIAINKSLIVHRLNIALSLRERFYQKPFYRLVYGDSDGLPGLIVDRYGDYCTVAISTAGMETLKEAIVEALNQVIKPKGIVIRNDSSARSIEGLDRYSEIGFGDVPESVMIEEGDCQFSLSLLEGQKTGWFYDQAANRRRMLDYVEGKTVLDVCSYIGAWSLQAARAGAQKVTSVDVSESALDRLFHNAELNGVSDKVEAIQGDAFEALKALKQGAEKFDVIILDPPAFIKRRKDIKSGLIAYRRLNEMAIRLLNNDGILISASCSFHLSSQDLLKILQQSARHNDRWLQVLEEGKQGRDHPVNPAIVETGYLKAFYCRVLRSS